MVQAEEKPLVTITGVTGFLGAQTALAFLEDGSFKVRGTVRSTSNAAKIDPLKKTLGDLFEQLELVEADLLDKDSVVKSIEGSQFVAHTASPFIQGVKQEDADTVIKPAVDGTLAVLDGCKAAGVKRVVITSSMAAISAVAPEDKPEVWDETHWSNPDRPGGLMPYTKSKYLAEKAAWDYLKDLPEAERFEMVTVNPVLILGPAYQTEAFTSGNIFKRLLLGERNPLPKASMEIVDVRDVALAHVKALTVDEAKGHRVIVWKGEFSLKELADILDTEFTAKGWPIVTEESTEGSINKGKVDVSPATDILGIKFRDIEDTVLEMARCMIESGFVTKPE